ncbi:14506_t:CDS:1, partial [Dentiscutata erythropus]
MWQLKTISSSHHVLRISSNIDSFNHWLLAITVLASLLEAILFPVLISITWILLFKIKQKINGSEFSLCMDATYGSMLRLILNTFLKRDRLTKGMRIFIFIFFMATILGKNIPNVVFSRIIGIYNFTEVINSKVILFNNDLNCSYSSCTADFESNFALVSNSTTIRNAMLKNNVQKAYWGENNGNNTLYAVQAKTNATTCNFIIGSTTDSLNNVSVSAGSNRLENVTNKPLENCNSFTAGYNSHIHPERIINIDAFSLSTELSTIISDRCDIPMNMFLISSNFSSNVNNMANWLINGGCYTYNFNRECSVSMSCDISISWKKMQIFGDTPDNIVLLDAKFNNSLESLFSHHISSDELNGKIYGDLLIGSIISNMSSVQTRWANTIKYQGNQSNFNFLDEFDSILSQSLVSAVQSFTNNVSVNVDKIIEIPALGIWLEFTAFAFALFLLCGIAIYIFGIKNDQLLLSLSVLDIEVLSNAIFKGDIGDLSNITFKDDGTSADGLKISWPFVQDTSEELFSTNLAYLA